MTAYREELPAKGLSMGFNSCAPDVVMACRVDHASNVAAPLEAMVSPRHRSCFRRFSARNSATDTFMGLPDFRKAKGAGAFNAGTGAGASGRAAESDMATGSSGAAIVAVAEGKEFSALRALVDDSVLAGCTNAAFSAEKESCGASCG